MSTLHPEAQHLTRTGQALRQQLQQLDGTAAADGQALAAVLAALDAYEQAVLACLPPVPAWQLNPDPTPAELLAERQADPVYRLGFVRGFKAGQAAGQLRTEPALQLYARYAGLPAPPDSTALVEQVRRFVAYLQQRAAGTAPVPARLAA